MTSYDLVVLGAGAAGLGAADGARNLGKSVALLEVDEPGGDCTYTGCIPSKTLIETARRVREARNGNAYGFRSVVEVDFPAVMARVRAVVAEVAKDESPDHLRRRGIDVWPGRARLLGDGEIRVGNSTVHADRIIVATGAMPTIPPIAGLPEVDHLTPASLFDLTEMPPQLVVLGGGVTGCELAQAYARLGSTVTLVESRQRVLPDEEPEVAAAIGRALEASGVRLVLGRTVTGISPGPQLLLSDATVVSGSHLLLAVGRTPLTKDLGLEAVGAEVDATGSIKVDEHLTTTAEGIFAAGDCASALMYTHVAYEQGRLAAHNAFAASNRPALLGGRREWDPSAIPRVTFTDPEVAHVGLTEAQAFAAYGETAQVSLVSDRTSDRARCAGRTEGFVKMIAVPPKLLRSKLLIKLVGMSVVGPVAGELITQGTLAMRAGVLVGRIAQSVHAYPTWSMSVRICAAQFFGGYGEGGGSPGSGAAMTEPEPASAVTMQAPIDSPEADSPDAGAAEAGAAEARAAEAGAATGPAATVPREPRWRVARTAIGLWTVEAIIQSLFLLIPALAAALFIPDDAPGWLVRASDILPWALTVLLLAEILLLPRYKYAVHRWEVTADGVYTLTGWLSRTWILVPISRIQTVDVTRGPLQRMFGLASVSVRTASAHGSVEIHQLEQYTAAQVADDLSKRANLYDDDAT